MEILDLAVKVSSYSRVILAKLLCESRLSKVEVHYDDL